MDDMGEWQESARLGEIIGLDVMGAFPKRKVDKNIFILVTIARLIVVVVVGGIVFCKILPSVLFIRQKCSRFVYSLLYQESRKSSSI